MEEKIRFKNYFNEDLVGIVENSMPGPVVVLVHGFCGNKDENGLFKEFAQYLSDHKINSFRFDISGIGESSGDFKETTIRKQASDLNAAIEQIEQIYPYLHLGLIGFSLGATVALRSMNPNIRTYSFWSPAFFPYKDMFPRYDLPETWMKIVNQGYIDKNGIKVGRAIIEDLRTCDTSESISSLVKPVQIIHGTADPRIDYKSSIEAARILKCEKELVLIDGANHSYKNNAYHRKQVFEKTTAWLKKHLK